MNIRTLFSAALLIAATSGTAFASGYGPAPFYRPDVHSAIPTHSPNTNEHVLESSSRAYGGTINSSETGTQPRRPSGGDASLFLHH